MSRALLVLDDAFVREKAKRWIDQAPPGTRVEYKAPKRSLEQNSMMWACLTEVADQVTHHGLKLTTEDWKLIFIDALKRENRIAPNLEGTGFVSLGRSTSDLSKEEMTDMIELIMAFGAKHGVVFKDSNTNSDDTPTSEDAASPAVSEPEGSAPSHASGSSLFEEDSTKPSDKEMERLRAYAKDVLNTAGNPATTADLMKKVEGRWATEISGFSSPAKNIAGSIARSVRAIMRGDTSAESAIMFHAEGLGVEPEEIGGVK